MEYYRGRGISFQLRGSLVFYAESYDFATLRWIAVDADTKKIVKQLKVIAKLKE